MINTSLANVPTRSFDRLDQLMEEMFGNRFDYTPWSNWTPWTPAVDIKETEKEYVFVVELAGFKPEEVNVELSNDILTIYGKREKVTSEKNENFIRRERYFGEFKRSFKMDTHVRPDSIVANFKDGVLFVNVPKIEAVKPTRVPINT